MNSLKPGVYLQIYRGAIRGRTVQDRRDTLARYVDKIAVMSVRHCLDGLVRGPVYHGFCEEMVDAWPRLAKLSAERGLPALASWGLDGRDLSPTRKGDLVGQVLAARDCTAGLLDAEGQWDSDLGAADDMDEKGAIDLGRALRARAPDALVGDQPWYAIEAHTNARKTAKPLELGGTLSGFPVEEFGFICNLGRFRQAYIYNDRGGHYRPTFERMDREWASVRPALAAVGADQPLRVTLQGYRWKLHELVHALLDRCVSPAVPLVMWCDPWPDAVALAAIDFVDQLVHEGFAGPGCDPREAVRAWQRSYNATAPENARISVDGWGGLDSAAAAGIDLAA